MKLWLCLVFLVFSVSGFFVEAKGEFSSEIQKKIQQSGLAKSSLGIVISDTNSSKPLYTLNENKLFTPASLAKIPSLLALYDFYPLNYSFKTVFVSSAPVEFPASGSEKLSASSSGSGENGVLQGDLVLIGGGDSSFTSESLWKLVNILTRSGIKQVKGSLLIDDRLYKKEPPLAYSERSYSAPSSASSFNWNSVAFYIRPAKKLQHRALIYANPQNSYIKVINKVKTGTKNQIRIKRLSVTENQETFEIKGTINIQSPEKTFYRNISNPPIWLGHNALAFLQQRGISVLGGIKKGHCSGGFLFDWPLAPLAQQKKGGQKKCRILAEWESRPFSFHSYNMMKYSSNFVTRMLVSHIPLLQGQKQGDLKVGMEQLRQSLKKRGLSGFKLIEPSGLDRKNKFSPQSLHTALSQFENQKYSPELLFSYPFSQGEGTLKSRFKELPPTAFVRAKTGSLYGVLGLAGWVQQSQKPSYRFVFIYNGSHKKQEKAQKLFDEIIKLLVENRA